MSTRTAARVLLYGDDGDVVARDVVIHDDLTSSFTADSPWGSVPVVLGARGRHNVDNALAALAVAGACAVDLAAAATALRQPRWSPWRMELLRSSSGVRVINDAYNANPTSMAAALRALRALPARRRVAVVGVMAELGTDSAAHHRAVRALAEELGVRMIAVAAPDYGGCMVASIDEALDAIGPLDPDDVVLVKGSRVAGLERLAARLAR
jgi:UDP-N-acetylmuramoyl-tripeptide--D-alanyl-D-alanine ligase